MARLYKLILKQTRNSHNALGLSMGEGSGLHKGSMYL